MTFALGWSLVRHLPILPFLFADRLARERKDGRRAKGDSHSLDRFTYPRGDGCDEFSVHLV